MTKERFEILRSNAYYFRLVAPNNENIGYDTDYNTKEACKLAISEVRTYSKNTSNFYYWQSSQNSQWYFNLRKGSKEAPIILRSEGYTSKDACFNGIDSVQTYAPTAEIIDRT